MSLVRKQASGIDAKGNVVDEMGFVPGPLTEIQQRRNWIIQQRARGVMNCIPWGDRNRGQLKDHMLPIMRMFPQGRLTKKQDRIFRLLKEGNTLKNCQRIIDASDVERHISDVLRATNSQNPAQALEKIERLGLWAEPKFSGVPYHSPQFREF